MPRRETGPGTNRIDNRKILNPLTGRMISMKSSLFRELIQKGLVSPPEGCKVKDLSRPMFRIVPQEDDSSETSSDDSA